MTEYMGGGLSPAQQRPEQSTQSLALIVEGGGMRWPTTAKRSAPAPTNERINETIAGTGPGIPDEALAPGEELPRASERRGSRADRQRNSDRPTAERDTLPLEGE